jgi:hypothetical protein
MVSQTVAMPEDNAALARWIGTRLPVFTFLYRELRDDPTPRNLNSWWNFLAGIIRLAAETVRGGDRRP